MANKKKGATRKVAADKQSRARNKASKRSTRTAMPKTIAGIKLPKALRESTTLGAIVNNPLGRQVLADAMVAAAAAAAAALTRNMPSTGQMAKAGEAAVDRSAEAASATRDLVQNAVGAVAGAVTNAVGDAAQKMLPAALGGGDAKPARGRRGARMEQQPMRASARRKMQEKTPAATRGGAALATTRRRRRGATETPASGPGGGGAGGGEGGAGNS